MTSASLWFENGCMEQQNQSIWIRITKLLGFQSLEKSVNWLSRGALFIMQVVTTIIPNSKYYVDQPASHADYKPIMRSCLPSCLLEWPDYSCPVVRIDNPKFSGSAASYLAALCFLFPDSQLKSREWCCWGEVMFQCWWSSIFFLCLLRVTNTWVSSCRKLMLHFLIFPPSFLLWRERKLSSGLYDVLLNMTHGESRCHCDDEHNIYPCLSTFMLNTRWHFNNPRCDS